MHHGAFVLRRAAYIACRLRGGGGKIGCMLDISLVQRFAYQRLLGGARLDRMRSDIRQADAGSRYQPVRIERDTGSDAGDGIIAHLALKLAIGAAAALAGSRNANLYQDFIRMPVGFKRRIGEGHGEWYFAPAARARGADAGT